MTTALGIVVGIAAVLLATGAALAVVRVERGPSMLDRTVGLDVLTTTLVGAVALEAAWSRRTETLPILVVLSLVGFVGSVVVARFAAVEPAGRASEGAAAGQGTAGAGGASPRAGAAGAGDGAGDGMADGASDGVADGADEREGAGE